MDEQQFYYAITFHMVQEALQFEKKIKEKGYQVKLMPSPRTISASCGTAAVINTEDYEKIKELADREKIPYDEFHKVPVKANSSLLSSLFKKKK